MTRPGKSSSAGKSLRADHRLTVRMRDARCLDAAKGRVERIGVGPEFAHRHVCFSAQRKVTGRI